MTITIDGAQANVISDAIEGLKQADTPLSNEPIVTAPGDDEDMGTLDISGLSGGDLNLLREEIERGKPLYANAEEFPSVTASEVLLKVLPEYN